MKPVKIFISIGDSVYTMRYWHNVPHVGDHIVLTEKKEGMYIVESVIWSGAIDPEVNLRVRLR